MQIRAEAKRRFMIGLVTLLVAASVVAWVVLMNHPQVQYGPLASFCRPLYARAHNRIDTTKVDGWVPPDGNRSETDNPLRCGDLRRAGLLDDSVGS